MAPVPPRRDPGTRSNYEEWVIEHTTTNFTINFDKKRLEGKVTLRLKKLAQANKIVLDANHLKISSVNVNGSDAKGFNVTEGTAPHGGTLTVPLSDTDAQGSHVDVEIDLETTERCTALQWFTPEQTSNKKHPYMFSQCQPNHARSVFPCQDTPAVKSTFDNTFKSSLPVLNSGLDAGDKDGVYRFKQDVPIPSYLYALASGDISRAPIGKSSQVATGPEELDACRWEFEADMDSFLAVMEKDLLPKVPYAWGTYNVLICPPSFPFGGMENPIWTYATPTVISGDRQNVDVIAHELSHSWSGNLVTSMSWEHFWLNEGWTVYLERRIQEVMHGSAQFHFSAIVGWKALTDAIENFGEDHGFTQLVVDLENVDPDDAFSTVPYEKGFTFLYYLDKLVGRAKWDAFANHYFQTWARKSLDSWQFKKTLLDFFAEDKEASEKLKEVDWDTWFFKPGYPPKPDFDTSMADVCYALAEKWHARSTGSGNFEPSPDDIKDWTASQVVVFIERVDLFEKPLSAEDSQKLGSVYNLASSQNVEIVARYFKVALTADDKTQYQPVADLLGKVGRMKFVRPLYKALNKVDRDLAVKTFEKNKGFYHPICKNMVSQDLFGQTSK